MGKRGLVSMYCWLAFQHALSNFGVSYRYGHVRRDKWSELRRGEFVKGKGTWRCRATDRFEDYFYSKVLDFISLSLVNLVAL